MYQTIAIPDTIEQVNRAWNQEGRRSGNEWLYRCPFHDDQHPSMSVNPGKEVYHCFGCQASGHISQIIGPDMKPQVRGVVAIGPQLTSNNSFNINNGGKGVVATLPQYHSNNSSGEVKRGGGVATRAPNICSSRPFEAGAEMWDGVLSDLETKHYERDEKVKGCGKMWNTFKCGGCGATVAFQGFCHDSLCIHCRRRLAYAFFAKRDELDNLRVKSLVSLQMRPELVESVDEAKEQMDRGRKVIAKATKELGIIGYIYSPQPRIGNGLSAPVFTVLLPCDELKREHFLILWVRAGGTLGPDVNISVMNLQTVVDRFIEYTTFPFYAHTTDDIDMGTYLVKGMKHFQGVGGLYRVTGGAMKDKSERPPRVCPVCSGTDLTKWGKIDGENIICYKGGHIWRNPHWGKPGVEIPAGLDLSLIK
ncbi:MAG: DNA primase [Chloroflexi bacterium]|nr:DNA primase [Chloroflexota bacterium]